MHRIVSWNQGLWITPTRGGERGLLVVLGAEERKGEEGKVDRVRV